MKHPINLALTPGAEDGIGPTVLLKAIELYNPADPINYFWCADKESLKKAALKAQVSLRFSDDQAFLNEKNIFFMPVTETDLLKRQAIFLQNSIELAQNNHIQAVVTGPIDKRALAYLKEPYPGQTEYFAHHLGVDKPFMAFMGGPFIMSLNTTHLPLSQVSKALSKDSFYEHLISVEKNCEPIIGKKPKIIVLGLNPHAGEHGLLGHEENEIMRPVIYEAKKLGMNIFGPVPADGFFAYFHKLAKKDVPDVVVAMYHDQGLIPYKLLSRGQAVNVTMGLSIPRTSPAHGTATSLLESPCPLSALKALEIAMSLVKK